MITSPEQLVTIAAQSQSEVRANDILASQSNVPSGVHPIAVPDRNVSVISCSTVDNSFSNSSLEQPQNADLMSNGISITGTAPTDQTSSSGSTQLPVGSGAELGNGVSAASDTSLDAATNLSDTADVQDSLTPSAVAFTGGLPASPMTDADLQHPSNILNNGFATLGNVGNQFDNNMNYISNAGKDAFDRVKLRFAPGHPYASYPSGSLLGPLGITNGLVWPFRPTVSIANTIEYETMGLTHSIQEIHAFGSNKATTITISGTFISQTVDEALYTLAAIHFLRTSSKMAFGMGNTTSSTGLPSGVPVGSPPPVLLLSGYGPAMLNDLPVIITAYGPLELPTDINYVEIPFGPGYQTKIPVSLTISVSLTVQQAPQNMRNFNLDQYAQTGIKSWW